LADAIDRVSRSGPAIVRSPARCSFVLGRFKASLVWWAYSAPCEV